MRTERAGAKRECGSMAGARVCLACSPLLLSLVSCWIPTGLKSSGQLRKQERISKAWHDESWLCELTLLSV